MSVRPLHIVQFSIFRISDRVVHISLIVLVGLRDLGGGDLAPEAPDALQLLQVPQLQVGAQSGQRVLNLLVSRSAV